MRNLQSFFVLILLIPLALKSQTTSPKIEVQWGEELKESRYKSLSAIIGHDESGFYGIKGQQSMFSGSDPDLTLVHYDNNFNQTNSNDLKLLGAKKQKYNGYIHVNGKYYMFSSYLDKETDRNKQCVQTMNMPTLSSNNDTRVIAEIDYSDFSRFNKGKFLRTLSSDDSKILIISNLPFDRGEKVKCSFKVFNTNMELIWEKDVSLPYNNELFDLESYRLANDGSVYLLCTVYKEKRLFKRQGDPNYNYALLCYKQGSDTPDEYIIDLPGKFITDMRYSIKSNNEIEGVGFYSEKGTYSVKGTFFVTLDASKKELKTQSFKEFSLDVLLENLSDKEKEKIEKKIEKGKEVELYDYDISDIIRLDDGGYLVCSEQVYEQVITTMQMTSTGAMVPVTNTYYSNNDIIVLKISAENIIEWVSKIPKRQDTSNDNGFYSSYYLRITNDKLQFLFNDNPENLLPETIASRKFKYFRGQKGSVVVLTEMDFNGNYTKEALFNNADADVVISPKLCTWISPNEILIYGQRGRKQKLGKLTFK